MDHFMDVDLAQRTPWIFDMDGTLTVAAIDFAALRLALDIPPTADIIGHIDALRTSQPPSTADWPNSNSTTRGRPSPSPGPPNYSPLRARGARLAFTRNSVENAEGRQACGATFSMTRVSRP